MKRRAFAKSAVGVLLVTTGGCSSSTNAPDDEGPNRYEIRAMRAQNHDDRAYSLEVKLESEGSTVKQGTFDVPSAETVADEQPGILYEDLYTDVTDEKISYTAKGRVNSGQWSSTTSESIHWDSSQVTDPSCVDILFEINGGDVFVEDKEIEAGECE